MLQKSRRRGNYSVLSNFTWHVPGVGGMFGLLLWLLVGTLLGNMVTLLFSSLLGPELGAEYGTLVSYPLMFIPAMIYSSAVSMRNSMNRTGVMLDSSHFGEHKWYVPALVVTAGTIATSFVAEWAGSFLPPMPDVLKELLGSLTSGKLWLNLLMVSIFAPFFEEWLCRGMVLRGLLHNKVKPVWAIVISAVFFAVIHANPWQAVPAFLLGCLFGYVYYKTGSLKLTMLMHCVNNTFAVVLSHMDRFAEMETWRDVFHGTDYYVILSCCAVIVALVVLFFSKLPLLQPEGNSDIVPSHFEE